MAEPITRGLTTENPHDLSGMLYPLFAGVKRRLRETGVEPESGEYVLSLTWRPKGE